jgi:hypothetical protein
MRAFIGIFDCVQMQTKGVRGVSAFVCLTKQKLTAGQHSVIILGVFKTAPN